MKRLLILALMMCAFLTGCKEQLSNDKVYFFTKESCPYCTQAENYISANYPDLKVEYKNIKFAKNRDLFMACAQKFKLNKHQLGTPLICMGDNYVLGWSAAQIESFQKYVLPFVK